MMLFESLDSFNATLHKSFSLVFFQILGRMGIKVQELGISGFGGKDNQYLLEEIPRLELRQFEERYFLGGVVPLFLLL